LRLYLKNTKNLKTTKIEGLSTRFEGQDHQEKRHTNLMCDSQHIPQRNTSKTFPRKFLQEYPRIRKRKTQGLKGFGTRLRGRFHYESLSHIRLQATHKNMAKSSNKEPLTPLSLSPKEHPK
jgi:hypothetical protein